MDVNRLLSRSTIAVLAISATAILNAEEPKRAKPLGTKYDLVFQECPRFSELDQRKNARSELLSRVAKESLKDAERVDALVELGTHTPAAEIPWKELLVLVESNTLSPSVELWCVITAGKRLSSVDAERELERWIFQQMRDSPHRDRGQAAVIVLAASGIGHHAALREWSRLLRNSATPEPMCQVIYTSACAANRLYENISSDESLNCLLAGYDEANVNEAKKMMFWEQCFIWHSTWSHSEDMNDITLMQLHELGLREFANGRNSPKLRAMSTTGLKRKEKVSASAVAEAQKILATEKTIAEIRSAATHIVERSNKFGVAK